jgi:hypothetical protein
VICGLCSTRRSRIWSQVCGSEPGPSSGALPFFADNPEPVDEESDHCDHGQHRQRIAGIAERLQDVVVTGPEGEAQTGQRRAPDGAADDGEDHELRDGHLTQSGGEGHEGAEQGNETAEQNQGLAAAVEPLLGRSRSLWVRSRYFPNRSTNGRPP